MKIGVIGGGQLGRMLALAGTPLGMNFAFLDPAPDACAAALGEHLRADYGDLNHLRQLADEVDLVTFEFESVPCRSTRVPKRCASRVTAGLKKACSRIWAFRRRRLPTSSRKPTLMPPWP
ncbi:phosphoribosylaminoimidazole carboxylase ATPase subunit, partial [Pseudomonas syringae pv. actinidiae ICMP 18804]